jgi:hypothetical protein
MLICFRITEGAPSGPEIDTFGFTITDEASLEKAIALVRETVLSALHEDFMLQTKQEG